MSVSACEVSSLALRRSDVSFLHHTESATTTPSRALSLTRALAVSEPRSLKTRTTSPFAIPRAAASPGWISRLGSPASAIAKGMLAKDELRKFRFGREMIASGDLPAGAGVDCADSRGRLQVGSGSIPRPIGVPLYNAH